MSKENKFAEDIGELNLGYLLLAQRLIKEDMASAMFRLGLSRDLAIKLSHLSITSIVRMANSGHLVFGFRLDEMALTTAITDAHKMNDFKQAHTAILLARQSFDAVHEFDDSVCA